MAQLQKKIKCCTVCGMCQVVKNQVTRDPQKPFWDTLFPVRPTGGSVLLGMDKGQLNALLNEVFS